MIRTGLILKSVPRAAAAGVMRPPFFRYFKVSTVIKITESAAVSSRRFLICAPSIPIAANICASFTDWYWVTEIRRLSTTNTFPSYSSSPANIIAVEQEPESPEDIGIWTIWSYSFNSLSHIFMMLSGVGWEVEISELSFNFR